MLTDIPILFLIWGCEARKGVGHLEGFQWWSENRDCKPGTGHLSAGISFSWEIESLKFHQGNLTLLVLCGIRNYKTWIRPYACSEIGVNKAVNGVEVHI